MQKIYTQNNNCHDYSGARYLGAALQQAQKCTGLNCNSSTWFWFAWSGGLIQVGGGTATGNNVFVQYRDSSNMTVRAVGVTIYVTPVLYSISDSM